MANVEMNETQNLIASNKVEGTAVFNAKAEKLGSVHNFMVNKLNGRVAYAVMSFGGFLGIGEKYHPLPWEMLRYDEDLNGYVVNLERDQLEKAPSYGSDEVPWSNIAYGRQVHDYYGVKVSP